MGFPGNVGGHHQGDSKNDEGQECEYSEDGFERLCFSVFVAHEPRRPERDDGVEAARDADDRCVAGRQEQIGDAAGHSARGEQEKEMFERHGAQYGASEDNQPNAVEEHVHEVTVHHSVGEKSSDGLSWIETFCTGPEGGPETKEEGGDVAPVLAQKVAPTQYDFQESDRCEQEPEGFGYRI